MNQLSGGTQNEVTPYFVYGTLKPAEIAYYQIIDLVEEFKPARLNNYALYVRDGVPVIFKDANSYVEGFLIWPKKSVEDMFKSIVKDYEGERLYVLEKTTVTCESQLVVSLVHVGKNPGRSYAEPLDGHWTSKNDPIFSQSFPNLFSAIKKVINLDIKPAPIIQDWQFYNDLTSKYLTLITVIERLAYMYCGEKFTEGVPTESGIQYNDRVMIRVTTLGKSPQFISAYKEVVAKGNISHVKTFDSRDAKKRLSTTKDREALETWYQVRSNLQHRGKSAWQDVKIVQDSLIGLANVTSVLLPKFIPTLEDSVVYKQLNLAELIIASLPVSQLTDKPG